MGEKEAKVLDMLTSPVEADPDPTFGSGIEIIPNMPAKIGTTTNIMARASRANNGTMISTRLFCTAAPAMRILGFGNIFVTITPFVAELAGDCSESPQL